MKNHILRTMMCVLFVALAALLWLRPAQAQDLSWATQAGGTSSDGGHGIAVDGSGSSYVTGHFEGSAGINDIFVAKYDAGGSLLWVQEAGGSSTDGGYSIAVDGSGSSYVTGHFRDSATFGPTTLTSVGGDDIFVAKYDPNGVFVWAKQAGGTSSDLGRGIAVDGSGNSYVTGYFGGSATFGSTTLTGAGSFDIFVAKYDPNGSLQWVKQAGGTSTDWGYGIAVDGSGNSYVTGDFYDSATFDSTTLTSAGDDDIFVAKYDLNGSLVWVKQAGGSSYDRGYGIAVDGSGNSYVTGVFWDSATFGSTTLTSAGINDIFVAKYDAGGSLVWVQQAGGSSYEGGYGIAVDGSGNSYVTGYFVSSATFDLTTLTGAGNRDIFVAKYDAGGSLVWAKQAGGTSSDWGYGIAVDGSGNSYVTGDFGDSATFDSTTLTSAGGDDIFVAKYGPPLPLSLPMLYVEDEPAQYMHGASSFTVPVMLDTSGLDLSSVGFALGYNDTCLALDTETDSDGNGIPDSITDLPEDFEVSPVYESGKLTLAIKSPRQATLLTLSDGVVATVEFDVVACTTTDGSTQEVIFTFPASTVAPIVPSFGNSEGQAVAGTTDDGTYTLWFNYTPTDMELSNSSVEENKPAGTPVGSFSVDNTGDVDLDLPPSDIHTFELAAGVAGCDDSHNYAFQMADPVLQTAGPFDFESLTAYNICVRTTDLYGASYTEAFTIDVVDVNEAPTAMALDDNHVTENGATGDVVGTLSTSDEDLRDDDPPPAGSIVESHSYSVLSGGPFEITDTDKLAATETLNHEAVASYNVTVQSCDSANQCMTQLFTILVDDINDAPVAVNDPDDSSLIVVGDGAAVPVYVLANDTDQDVGTELIVSRVDDSATHADAAVAVAGDSSHVLYTAPTTGYSGPDTFDYWAEDDGKPGTSALESVAPATVSLNVVANHGRGDCNADGQVDAADFPATVLEIFDFATDESISWWKTHTGDFAGSPKGCDSNGSENGLTGAFDSVDAADIICTVLIFFGADSCGGVQAADATDMAGLSVDEKLTASAGSTASVPILLDTGGNSAAALTFALEYDATALSFDDTDANGDGLPDAVRFTVPESMASMVLASEGRVQVAIFGTSLPMPLLTDGAVATVELAVDTDAAGSAVELSLTQVSLGSDAGRKLDIDVTDGMLQIVESGADATLDQQIFLPVAIR